VTLLGTFSTCFSTAVSALPVGAAAAAAGLLFSFTRTMATTTMATTRIDPPAR
jgi:hypothetical protein